MAAAVGLAIATVVPVSSSSPPCQLHLRRGLVTTKPHSKTSPSPSTSIMATATPSGYGNRSQRLDRMMTRSRPTHIGEDLGGVPVKTDVVVVNHTGETLTLVDCKAWDGEELVLANLPQDIRVLTKDGTFLHHAIVDERSRGSSGALVYLFPNKPFKWVIAWANLEYETNTVYTEILYNKDVDLDVVRGELKAMGKGRSGYITSDKFFSRLRIDPDETTPTVHANVYLKLLASKELAELRSGKVGEETPDSDTNGPVTAAAEKTLAAV